MIKISKAIAEAKGLPDEERGHISELGNVLLRHASANAKKRKYYEGHIPLGAVNLGLALPRGLRDLEIGCAWGEKAVDVLAARSMFDGFVGAAGQEPDRMTQLVSDNRLIAEYMKACRDELKYGCTFATLSADEVTGCRIRFHSPETASAVWDGEKGRIGRGLAVIAMDRSVNADEYDVPTIINYYTDEAIWQLRRSRNDDWTAFEHPHKMGRPLMEPLVYNATSAKPFGRSRLKEPIRRLIEGYVRTVANATIGLEFSTAPQKYLLGVTDEQYDALIDDKFRAYVGSLIAATPNPETGTNPVFGQLSQGTIQPHVDMMRILATQFSAATGLTTTDVGIVNDANPTSSEAIIAQSQTLILLAEQLNAGNANALQQIARMALAIAANVTPAELSEDELSVVAHFKNPAMPSVASTADAAIKIASTREGFAQTDVFLEMIGFDQADIRRIKGQEARARGRSLFFELQEQPEEVTSHADTEEGLAEV